jgi:hypothetical protein
MVVDRDLRPADDPRLDVAGAGRGGRQRERGEDREGDADRARGALR